MPFSYHNSNSSVPPRMVDGVGFGKIAIITGCSSGIGLATLQLFLSHQYQVFGVDINELDYTKVEEKDQERLHFHQADLLSDGECDEVVRICVAEYGDKIDVLANVAGIMDGFAAADVFTDQEWDTVIGVNLTVPTRMMRAVLPFMRRKKSGSIINISSYAGISGASAGIAYTTSKHGLLGVTKHTAWRFRNEGIRCNAIMPGGVDTNIHQSMPKDNWDQESYSTVAPIHALVIKPGEKPSMPPSHIADLILFLASDQAVMINGASIPVDQGLSVI